MKKLLYIIRKIFGILMFVIAFVFVCMVVFGRQGGAHIESVQTFLTIFAFVFLFLGMFIYPSRTKYCSCGRKYTSMKYEYIETKTGKSKTKGNVKRTPYQYNINVVYYCEYCDKEYKSLKYLYGGEVLTYLDTGTYEDKKIPYDEALKAFVESREKKK